VERRLADLTCTAYERDVRACLEHLRSQGISALAEIRTPDLRRFLADEATHRPAPSSQARTVAALLGAYAITYLSWRSDVTSVAGKEQDIGPEWVSNDDPTDHSMPLADRIKQLRTEAGLSQAELAELVGGSDARQISRYEHGRITPSLDVAVRLAQALKVSLDYLAIDNIPRRPCASRTTASATASASSQS
jgi:DNA-binding XRE family transcriptional regulator